MYLYANVKDTDVGDTTNDDERNNFKAPEYSPIAAGETRMLRDRASLKLPARYEMNIAEYHVPETFLEAISGPKSTEWKQTIQNSMHTKRTRHWCRELRARRP